MFAGSLGEEQERAAQRRILERRKRDEERRLRVLNAKQRVMGVDRNGIEAQLRENQARNAAEKASDSLYSSTNEAIRNILEEEHLRLQEETAAREFELKSAWDIQQANKKHTYSYPLNDPNALKKDLPGRVGDDDPRCGTSSLQRFQGEDSQRGDRIRMQQMQVQDWTQQALARKQQQNNRAAEENRAYNEYLQQVDQVRSNLETAEAEHREQLRIELVRENGALREQRRLRNAAEDAGRKKLEADTQDFLRNNPMLCERRDQGMSRFPGRYRPDHWKGMTVSQLQEIQSIQRQQIEEKKARQAEERAQAAKEANLSDTIVDVLQQQYDREAQAAAERRLAYSQELLVQAREKKRRDVEQRELLGTNKLGDGFFNRFGASCRWWDADYHKFAL